MEEIIGTVHYKKRTLLLFGSLLKKGYLHMEEPLRQSVSAYMKNHNSSLAARVVTKHWLYEGGIHGCFLSSRFSDGNVEILVRDIYEKRIR